MRFGSGGAAPTIILLPPLFDEHNRTRRLIVTVARLLAEVGMTAILPDLPGQGESEVATEHATLEAWRAAAAALVEAYHDATPPHVASFRGGALIDTAGSAASIWRFAPVPGRAVLNDLRRAEAVSGRKDWSSFSVESPPALLVGNAINWALYSALDAQAALEVPTVPVRTVRLDSDPAVADRKLPGVPLWRRSEPGDDPALAGLLADDLAAWVRACAA